jgi:primosomal protein N' (replication factor Y)
VAVCVDRPLLSLDRPFTYQLPGELDAGVGSLVRVNFHGKGTRGWVLGPTDDVPGRMLPIHAVVSPVRFFDERMLELFRWMSDRYVAPLAAVIARSHPPRVASEEDERPATVRSERTAVAATAGVQGPFGAYRGGEGLLRAIGRGRGAFVLRPVPEGERTVVVQAVRSCLAGGRRAIVLVPEADPLPATAAAILDAFGDRACLYLGGDRRGRYRTWLDILAGRFEVVVGTRPAVFAPVRNLGLVWVAREHHPGHREERSPYYHVRDVALSRARLEDATCVMASLCPSSEAMVTGAPVVSPAARSWPPVEVVRPGPEGRAPRLVSALRTARRAFLYEPLPGYGVARVCRTCGEPAACSACGGVLRLEGGAIRCAVCQSAGRCASCGGSDFGIARGGAERVAEWAARAASVDVRRGTPAGPDVTVGGAEAVRDLGPLGLDLVAILDADLAARRPGLNARERALGLWMDASAWARPHGRVILQTRHPGDSAVQALVAGNPERVHRTEKPRRERAGFPPGCPVFRVTGGTGIEAELSTLPLVSLLGTGGEGETICLATVRPGDVGHFGRAMRRLATEGVVTRVEAEPHL